MSTYAKKAGHVYVLLSQNNAETGLLVKTCTSSRVAVDTIL